MTITSVHAEIPARNHPRRACLGPDVLVVDDDRQLRDIVSDALAEFDFRVTTCPSGDRALEMIRTHPVDLVILDLGLPGLGGLELLRSIRKNGDLPVIVLTGRAGTADRVVGLEMGADDYVTKPFSTRELAARVGSVLRRATAATAANTEAGPIVEFDDLEIDLRCRDVTARGLAVELTTKEFDLLAYLAASPRQVFSKSQLLRGVWDVEPDWQSPSTVAEHVHRLRRKIEIDPSMPRWIQTMRGAGYRFVP